MFTTTREGYSTRVWYKDQVVIGEILTTFGGFVAKDYRSVSQIFTFEPLAVCWIISRAKRRKSREKVHKDKQLEKLNFFA